MPWRGPWSFTQPPAHSPVGAGAAFHGVAAALRLLPDRRTGVRNVLQAIFPGATPILCDSGTSALRPATELASARRPGAPVALPAFGCFDVATAAVGAGVRVFAYDMDPATLGPDMESVERVLSRGAAAVVVAPLYGLPVDYDPVASVAARADAIVIEDAAQGDGGAWRGRAIGSFGVVTVLSFGRGKGWTGGGGGALLVRDAALAASVAVPGESPIPSDLRAAGVAVAQWAFSRPGLYALPRLAPWLRLGETVYRKPHPPRGMSRAVAAVLRRTRRAAAREREIRRRNAQLWLAALARRPGVRCPVVVAGGQPGWLRMPVLVDVGGSVADALRGAGVARSYPVPLPMLTPLRDLLVDRDDRWPGAELLARTLITAPTHRYLRPGHVQWVVERITGDGARRHVAVHDGHAPRPEHGRA